MVSVCIVLGEGLDAPVSWRSPLDCNRLVRTGYAGPTDDKYHHREEEEYCVEGGCREDGRQGVLYRRALTHNAPPNASLPLLSQQRFQKCAQRRPSSSTLYRYMSSLLFHH